MNNFIRYIITFIRHIFTFPYIWCVFLSLVCLSLAICEENNDWEFDALMSTIISVIFDNWDVVKIFGVLSISFIAVVFWRPMNAVYGLMGTTGSIRLFFVNFILITILFAGIYYVGFFKDAGISYDVNQPHIDYNYNAYSSGRVKKKIMLIDSHVCKKIVNGDTITETIIQEIPVDYQSIGWFLVWRNTILTALMQEPTEFFSIASTYNESIVDHTLSEKEKDKERALDKQKSVMFQWILIFQILISWIFFGVFISLLYNKFRYES